eukprot:TRINITY_DN2853_c1_g1_i3.p1 TRINITY_DN2853_c1_g1~~TRINITY_DN2853_c1_g1_i3.p1  ORF type:complete len:201 (+),score=45.11 TRINITY_DN2853_c1_g1_i3:1333-1935(+)
MSDAATEPAADRTTEVDTNIIKGNGCDTKQLDHDKCNDASDAGSDVLSNMAEGGASFSLSMVEEEQVNQPTSAPSTMPAAYNPSTPSLASENSTPPPFPGSDQAERMKSEFYFPSLAIEGTQNVDERYTHRERIGEGSYGCVYLAKEQKTGKQRALKVMNLDKYQEGFPLTSVREIKIAMTIAGHKNIAKLHEILISPGM